MTVKVDTDNAAFEDDGLRYECARILRNVADKIEAGEATGLFQTVYDVNGNDVGRWKLGDPSSTSRYEQERHEMGQSS